VNTILLTTAAIAALTAALVPTSCETASAMDYSYRVYKKQIVITASGDIELDEAKTFSRWFKIIAPNWRGRKPTTITFDSRGGNLLGALDLGDVIARHRLTTRVDGDRVCASSCVLAWASGIAKSATQNSVIAVHRPKLDGFDSTNPPVAAWTAELVAAYADGLRSRGASRSVVNFALTTPASEIHKLTPDELASWNVHVRKGQWLIKAGFWQARLERGSS
jgi:hypothetical protein